MIRNKVKEYILKFISEKTDLKDKIISKKIDFLLDKIYPSERVFRNLTRILENDYYFLIYSENTSFLLNYLEIILKVSAFSNYLTDILVRNPEFLTRFLSSGELHTDLEIQKFNDELEQQISIFKSVEKKIEAIKRFKRLHILRIGLRDILNLSNLEQTMLEHSFLTQVILDKVFRLSFELKQSKLSIKKPPSYSLISLGKLGGMELNFSSDVDLLCIYDNPDENFSSEILEYYDSVVKDFIKICMDQEDGNPLYRIDFRLRPDGKYSPLARSISYTQLYYETYGRDWERQMLLKMNFLSGDKKLYNKFYQNIENFIYPRSFFVPPQVFIKKFRKIYLEELSEKNVEIDQNLKHFEGGIRDVEFSVQALQLIHCGKIQELRTSNTIEAIKKLIDFNIIKRNEGKRLILSYKFFRKIENFIQLMDDRQLHSIPKDKDKYENLIRYTGLRSKLEFQKKLNEVRKNISNFSLKVFGENRTKHFSYLSKSIKVNDRENFDRKFSQLLQQFQDRTENFLSKPEIDFKDFNQRLFEILKNCENPEKVLTIFSKFFTTIQSTYQLIELINNKKFLKILLTIFDQSEILTQFLITKKYLRDLIFSEIYLSEVKISKESEVQEDQIKSFLFQIMFFFFFKKIKTNEVSNLLSNFINKVLTYQIEKNIEIYNINKNDLAVVSFGSYGTQEMHFKSDIDLLTIFSKNFNPIKAEKFSTNLLADLRERFKLLDAFQVDSRLRPEGRSSKLAWSIDEISKYISIRMRIWEFQSYTKMRLIYGNEKLFDELVSLIKSRLRNFELNFIQSEIKKNRLAIKADKISSLTESLDLKNANGGLMDLQFLVQAEILECGFERETIGKNFSEILKILSRKNEIIRTHQKTLKTNYEKMLKMILFNQVLTGKKGFLIDKNFSSKFVKKVFKIDQSTNIFNYFKKITEQNFNILKKISSEIFG